MEPQFTSSYGTEALKTSRCVMCYEGYTIAPDRNGAEIRCVTCCGTGWLTPQNICYCGRPCYYITEGIPHCGSKHCVEELEKAARIAKTLAKSFSYHAPPAAHTVRNKHFGGGTTPPWWNIENQGWD